jgi:hypothetical protein
MEELVELGISWVWMGLGSQVGLLEAERHRHPEADARTAAHGIKLLGSTIVGLEHHTPENIDDEIEHAVAHETDFHQFMLYTPVPGTPLYFEMVKQGRLLTTWTWPTSTGRQVQLQARGHLARRFQEVLDWAFQRDFERNGPSLYRICRTTSG